ncbi:hypothetical protein N9Q19_01895, partial [Puniceicoccaceae bacterium]|nr:hypothetical protein [Puniceicoccaceae bacterium]
MKYRSPTFYTRLFVLLGCCLLGSLILTAQDAEPAAAAETATIDEAADDDTLMGTFKKGGLAMYPLLAFSIATLGLVIYNGLTIRSGYIINQTAVEEEILPVLQEKDYSRAMEICDEHSSPVL